jgi:TonB family protein
MKARRERTWAVATLTVNQRPIGNAAVLDATYLNEMHRRIHPLFADWFLASLDALPASNPMNDPNRFTSVEIVLGRDGRVVKMGVVKTSGVTAFDVAALDTVDRAAPFGQPPAAILSSDGHVYVR